MSKKSITLSIDVDKAVENLDKLDLLAKNADRDTIKTVILNEVSISSDNKDNNV